MQAKISCVHKSEENTKNIFPWWTYGPPLKILPNPWKISKNILRRGPQVHQVDTGQKISVSYKFCSSICTPNMVNYTIFIKFASNWLYRFGRVLIVGLNGCDLLELNAGLISLHHLSVEKNTVRIFVLRVIFGFHIRTSRRID